MATAIGAAALAASAAFGVAPAHADPQDDQFVTIVNDLNIPTASPEEAGKVGRGVCDALTKGKIEPARTVRGVISQLMNQAGIDKHQAHEPGARCGQGLLPAERRVRRALRPTSGPDATR